MNEATAHQKGVRIYVQYAKLARLYTTDKSTFVG